MHINPKKHDQGRAEKRGVKRASVLQTGKLIYGGAWGSIVDCLILDITDSGARVETILAVDIPENFWLKLSDGTERRGCRRWASGNQLGIEFTDIVT